jgi:methylenetetrahydrofolate--tRNA-(uracil-5-)-methyltransferase
MNENKVLVIGGGLSGCEAALQLADAGIAVELWEMRPEVKTPAHRTEGLAELVCSNSLKGRALTSAHGLFKAELARWGSKLLPLAESASLAAGESLAVDRDLFSAAVTQAISEHPLIELRRGEIQSLDPHRWTILATGPLTSDTLAQDLFARVGTGRLCFFDSIAPVVEADSLDREIIYAKNRWDKGETADFLNCPLNKEEYERFVSGLVEADAVEPKPFEKGQLFEGCLPVEEMARRGPETLRFGPMRPIGLDHPATGERPYAVIQLRAENASCTLYNLVGFQTRLKWGTQKSLFRSLPGFGQAEFVRLGAMHRNTFIDSPNLLAPNLRLKGTRVFCAGQITGAEGYTEAIGTGFFAAHHLRAALENENGVDETSSDVCHFPEASCLASLTRHLTSPNADFQPMNFNFGLLPVPPEKDKRERKLRKERQIAACQTSWDELFTKNP